MRGQTNVTYPTGHQFIHFEGPGFYVIVVKARGKNLSAEQMEEFLRKYSLTRVWCVLKTDHPDGKLSFTGPESEVDEVLNFLGEFLEGLAVEATQGGFIAQPA